MAVFRESWGKRLEGTIEVLNVDNFQKKSLLPNGKSDFFVVGF